MHSLRSLFESAARTYPGYLSGGKVNSDAAAYELICRVLPNELWLRSASSQPLRFEGSTGKGLATSAPWIAAFDRRVTNKATKGYYVVYLFSVDFQRLYLCLAVGVTAFTESFGINKKALSAIESACSNLAKFTSHPSDFSTGPINLHADKGTRLHLLYEKSSICWKGYSVHNLPSDKQLEADFSSALRSMENLYRAAGADAIEYEAASAGLARKVLPTFDEKRGQTARVPSQKVQNTQLPISRSAKLVGDQGEQLVFKSEQERLKLLGRDDLAEKVRWLAQENIHPGYDIESFDSDGSPRKIEVKSSRGKLSTIILTENERRTMCGELSSSYWLYVVEDVFLKPRITPINNPFERLLKTKESVLTPLSWTLPIYFPEQ